MQTHPSRLVAEILSAEREHALGIRLLPAADRDRLRERIGARYGRSNWLWETAGGGASVRDADGWRWIGEFVGPRSCILLFNPGEEAEMFHVPSGRALHDLLANTFGFEFYVTDAEDTYLLCFNHHDVLVGWGSAAEWIAERRQIRG